VVADDLGDQSKTQARSVSLGGDEGIEQMRAQVFGYALAVVVDADDERQHHRRFAAGHRKPDPVLEGGGEADLSALGGAGLGGVLDQVEEGLDQLVAVAEDRRQGRVVALDEPDMAREAVLRDAADMLKHLMDVDGLALRGAAVREHFHAVHERADPVGLLGDQARELPVGGGGRGLEQLRGAADPRKRILHLVGEHRGHRGHGARGVAVDKLMVDLARDRTLMQRDHHAAVDVVQRRRGQGHQARPDPRPLESDPVLRHRGQMVARLRQQREGRAVGSDMGPQRGPGHDGTGGVEELLGRGVDRKDRSAAVDDDDGDRQRHEDRDRVQRPVRVEGRIRPVHRAGGQAACRSIAGAQAPWIAARIAAGSDNVMARARNSAAPGNPFAYQPICLRDMRIPVSVP
jgi:hypothetical protein